jgi:hypothetical protein
MAKTLTALALALTFLFSGCSEEKTSVFELTLDGTNKNVSVETTTLTVHSAEDSESGRAAHVLKIEGKTGEDSFEVTISNWDFQEPPEKAIAPKDYYNVFLDEELEVGQHNGTCMRVAANSNVCEGVIISYTKNGTSFYSTSNENSELIIQITKCDGQRTSGNFDLMLENPHNTTEKVHISGSFKDLKYKVRHI